MKNDFRSPKNLSMLIASMVIFSTIGLIRRSIPLPSATLAFLRGLIGMISLVVILALLKKPFDRAAIRKRLVWLLLSGALLGLNWILLFEAYAYTSVAVATLCYYMAPIFIILASPFLLKEKLSAAKLACVAAALAGMVLVSGALGTGGSVSLRGVALGLAAAVLYAAVVLCNKRLTGLDAYTKTIVQLGTSAIVLVPYLLLQGPAAFAVTVTPTLVALVLVAGIVHTGLAYALYFGSIGGLPAQTVALFSYIDPIGAVLLSALVLREPMGLAQALGAVLVLAAAVASERLG